MVRSARSPKLFMTSMVNGFTATWQQQQQQQTVGNWHQLALSSIVDDNGSCM
jgi:hypothetical protein